MIVRLLVTAVCVAVALPAGAGEVSFQGAFRQGGLILAHATDATAASLDGRAVAVAPDGTFVFGFGPEAKAEATLVVRFRDGTEESLAIRVAPQIWKVERIQGLPAAMVNPPAALAARINRENAAIARAHAAATAGEWFAQGFAWPVTGRISGVFGSRRVLNGQEMSPHWGLDVAVPTGTPVTAPAPGIVVLAEPDLYYTGGTVILDHGFGVTSTYSHLSQVSVRAGQMLQTGEALGAVGATGRVTGAHLDWRINWFDVRIDPALVVPAMPGG